MNDGKYIFSQIVEFLPTKHFQRLVQKHDDRTRGWGLTHWNQLLALIFGQLAGCDSLRELTDMLMAHSKKGYHLGLGKEPVNKTILSRANTIRNYHIFEGFAYHMIELAQKKRIDSEFILQGKFYAFDSTTIDLCLSLFEWATFRSTKSGIKIHTMFDVVTQIPTFFTITPAKVHDVNAMDDIPYETRACYIFDRGYFDFARLFNINQIGAFFIIREKGSHAHEVIAGDDLLEGDDNVLRDQTIRFTDKKNIEKYPAQMRRIVYYAPELKRTFTYYTNQYEFEAKHIALLYKFRWQVELFFKFIKQHLKVKSFWGNSENAVRIQIYIAIITYCLIAIIEHDLRLNRSIFEVMRILGGSLLTKDQIQDLFFSKGKEDELNDSWQLHFDFY